MTENAFSHDFRIYNAQRNGLSFGDWPRTPQNLQPGLLGKGKEENGTIGIRQAPLYRAARKGKAGPYSITERRVPELIPVLGSQPAADVIHKPAITIRQACSYSRNP